jgi:hypothetical protein
MINWWTPRESIAAEGDGCVSCSRLHGFERFPAGYIGGYGRFALLTEAVAPDRCFSSTESAVLLVDFRISVKQ